MKMKKVIIGGLVSIALISIISLGSMFIYLKSNVNYSKEELQATAIGYFPGEIISVKKGIYEEGLSLKYEFIIKDENNILREIELDTKTGAVIDLENFYKQFHN